MSKSLGCAGCGDCCDPVHLTYDEAAKLALYNRLLEGGFDPQPSNDTHEFARLHWTPVEVTVSGTKYRCDQFDPATWSCLAHESRPSVCRDYPLYGRTAAEEAEGMYPRCSYALDAPPAARRPDARPLIPIRAVTR